MVQHGTLALRQQVKKINSHFAMRLTEIIRNKWTLNALHLLNDAQEPFGEQLEHIVALRFKLASYNSLEH